MLVIRSIVAVTALTLLAPATGLAQTVAPTAVVRPPMAGPPPLPPLALPPPSIGPVPPTPTVFADVDGPDTLVLESWSGARWEPACALPCHVALPLARRLRVRGDGIRASRSLSLDAAPGQVISIGASAGGSAGGFAGGVVATSLGGSAMVVGSFVWLAGAICGLGGNACGSTGLENAGLITFGVGTAALVGGIVLLVTNPKSSATQFPAGSFSEPAPRADTSWIRLPMWRDVKPYAIGPSAGVALPVFSRSF